MSKWTNPYPRSVGDPFEKEGFHAGTVAEPVYAPGEFGAFVARVQEALAHPDAS